MSRSCATTNGCSRYPNDVVPPFTRDHGSERGSVRSRFSDPPLGLAADVEPGLLVRTAMAAISGPWVLRRPRSSMFALSPWFVAEVP
jgi:hypothetical protein